MPVKTYNPKRYNCNGSQKIFPFDFCITSESDIVAILIDSENNETTLTLTTHYTVSKAGANWDSGGNITTVQTYPSGYTIVIKRVVTIDQQTDYVYNDNFDDEAHEDVVDKLTMIAQQLHEELNRTLKLLPASAYTELSIPDPVADYLLAWKADKTGLKNVTGANIGDLIVSDWIKNNLLDDEDVATVRTTIDVSQKGNFYEQGGNNLKCKVIEIGDWNMDIDATKDVAHGIANQQDVRSVSILIRPDNGVLYDELFPLTFSNAGTDVAGKYNVGVTNIEMVRTGGDFFDNPNFDATTFNRGWISIWYV